MSDQFEKYKEYELKELKLWEETYFDVGGQVDQVLQKYGMPALDKLEAGPAEKIKMSIIGRMMQFPETILAFGHSLVRAAGRLRDSSLETLTDLSTPVSELAQSILSDKYFPLDLTAPMDKLQNIIENEPFKIGEMVDEINGIRNQMSDVLSDNWDQFDDVINKNVKSPDISGLVMQAGSVMNDARQYITSSFMDRFLPQDINAIIEDVKGMQNSFDNSSSGVKGIHYYKDAFGKLKDLTSMLAMYKTRNIGRVAAEAVPAEKVQDYDQIVGGLSSFENPDYEDAIFAARSLLSLANQLASGHRELTPEVEGIVREMKSRFDNETQVIADKLAGFDASALDKFQDKFHEDIKEVSSSMNMDRLSDSVFEGKISDIFDTETLTSTYEGYVGKALIERKKEINDLTTKGNIDILYTEMLGQHNVKILSGIKYTDWAALLEKDVKERREYIEELEVLWNSIQGAVQDV